MFVVALAGSCLSRLPAQPAGFRVWLWEGSVFGHERSTHVPVCCMARILQGMYARGSLDCVSDYIRGRSPFYSVTPISGRENAGGGVLRVVASVVVLSTLFLFFGFRVRPGTFYSLLPETHKFFFVAFFDEDSMGVPGMTGGSFRFVISRELLPGPFHSHFFFTPFTFNRFGFFF